MFLITQSLISIFETLRVKITEMDCLNTYNCTAIFILHLTAHQARASLSLPAMIWQLIICCELFLHLVIHARLFFPAPLSFDGLRGTGNIYLCPFLLYIYHTLLVIFNFNFYFESIFWSNMYAMVIRMALKKKLYINNNVKKKFTTNDKLSNHD